MNAPFVSLAPLLFVTLASPHAAAIDWNAETASATRAGQVVALPPSPCKLGAIECARRPMPVLPPSPCKLDKSERCASGKRAMCGAYGKKASRECTTSSKRVGADQ